MKISIMRKIVVVFMPKSGVQYHIKTVKNNLDNLNVPMLRKYHRMVDTFVHSVFDMSKLGSGTWLNPIRNNEVIFYEVQCFTKGLILWTIKKRFVPVLTCFDVATNGYKKIINYIWGSQNLTRLWTVSFNSSNNTLKSRKLFYSQILQK